MSDNHNNDTSLRERWTARLSTTLLVLINGLILSSAALAAPAEQDVRATLTYARAADLVIGSPAVATVEVRTATQLRPDRAPDLPPGRARFFVEADTTGLIRGNDVVAKRIGFLLDGPDDKTSRTRLRKRTFLIFGKVGPQVDQFQLASSTALVDWSAANEALVRKVISEILAPDAPPVITGISSAFHVPGAILGEGESQIFLDTSNGTPISLSIIRRPDEQPQFSASLGEIVDNAASLPAPDTPLWYRLACGLPDALPARALRGLEPVDADRAQRDYHAFQQALAPCARAGHPVL
ncbi:MAG TPA: hypothetical protein VNS79_03100 [Sphingobium sp.]|nr:hypothetical protein [Sphingobium sp.]